MTTLVANPNGRRSRWALIAIILVAFGVRAFQLDVQSLWYDEGVTAYVAQLPVTQLTQWTANDIQPPLYYYFVAFWGQAAGWSEFALRYPSLLSGVVVVALLAVLARAWAKRPAPEFAAAIAAVHPLLIYYSQEARMYALLVALGVLCGWLMSLALTRLPSRRLWVAYTLTATLAIYTHYFAFFLLLALGLAYLTLYRPLHPTARRIPLTGFLLANCAIVLFYIPWFSAMLTRLNSDASYWQGELKLGEALRHVATNFITGETVLERQAIWLTLAVAALSVAVVLLAWRRSPGIRAALGFGLIWLIVPVVGVLALASFAPKFNARYVMISLPGLILVWSVALGALLAGWRESPAFFSRRSPGFGARICAFALLICLAVSFTTANVNWFFDDSFAKAQWRQLVDFLRPRIAADETVILVSGHAWPVWDYYAPDLPPPLRLPAIDVLDVDAVLTFENTAAPLRAALESHPGAWLVSWQEEVVDPNDVAPVQLELSGREKGSSALFNQLTLRRFSRLRPTRIADQPPIQRALNASFGDRLVLAGLRGLDNGDLLLFWQKQTHQQEGESPAADDYHLKLETFDASGQLVAAPADRRLAGYTYPSFRWRAEEIVMGRIPAADWLGPDQKAGRYSVRLSVYDAAEPDLALLPTENGDDTLMIPNVEAIIE